MTELASSPFATTCVSSPRACAANRWFTVVMVVSQALSVSIFVTALTSARRYSNMAGQVRSDVFRVERSHDSVLGTFYRGTQFEGFGEFTANFLSLPTTRALSRTGLASAETVSFVGGDDRWAERSPAEAAARAVLQRRPLRPLSRVDFRYGGPWTRADERASPPVPAAVLSDVLNQALFGGSDSVGRTLRIAGRDFRVVGVMRQLPGKLHLWDVGLAPENIGNLMVPFAFADELRPLPVISWPPVVPDLGWAGICRPRRSAASPSTGSACRRPTARTRFASALHALDPQLALRSADEIAARYAHAPAPYRVFVILTLVVLEASVINVMRMLLAKATARAAEIGIHRALGAGRHTIFVRQLLEGLIVSMAGSLLGLALAVPSVAMFDRLIPDSPVALALPASTVVTVLLVCLLAGLVSGIYPAWRIASVPPTRYLGKI